MEQTLVLDDKLASLKNTAWWLYILHALSLVFTLGALSWIPLLISYLKRGEAEGTFVYSHHNWQIRSFWWYLVLAFIGWACFVTVIGIPLAFLIWGGAWLWKAYRLLRGLMDLNVNKPMP
jgi:uncharacterized membrane protein